MTPTITLRQKVIEGAQKGPNLLLLGGVHGDEFESMAAIRRLLDHLDPAALRGRLTAIPVVNEAAYWRGQRTAEDGLDLARTCPGRATPAKPWTFWSIPYPALILAPIAKVERLPTVDRKVVSHL